MGPCFHRCADWLVLRGGSQNRMGAYQCRRGCSSLRLGSTSLRPLLRGRFRRGRHRHPGIPVVVLFIRLVEIEYLRKSETVANPGRIDEDIHELHRHWCCKGLAGFSENHTFHGGYSRDRWRCQTIGRRLEGTPRWARRRDCTRAWRALWVTSQLRKWCKDVLDFF